MVESEISAYGWEHYIIHFKPQGCHYEALSMNDHAIININDKSVKGRFNRWYVHPGKRGR